MICAGASEQGMSQWASAFAESGLGVSKAAGDIAGPCLFALLMGMSRLFYSRFSERLGLKAFMTGSGILCIASYLLAAFSPYPLLAFAGCGLCGFSVGILWPGTFSLASLRCPKGGTAMFALLALAGDLGCSSGPTLVGMVSNALGDNLKRGLAAALVFPVLLIAGLFFVRTKTAPSSKSSGYT
jgi:MFS family permease